MMIELLLSSYPPEMRQAIQDRINEIGEAEFQRRLDLCPKDKWWLNRNLVDDGENVSLNWLGERIPLVFIV